MTLTMNTSTSVPQPCAYCGVEDEAGGIRLEDNTGATRVFCRPCTRKLIEVVLTPMQTPVVADAGVPG